MQPQHGLGLRRGAGPGRAPHSSSPRVGLALIAPCTHTPSPCYVQTLTQLLLYTMFAMRAFGESAHTNCGAILTAQEVQELEGLNRGSLHVLEAMVVGGRPTQLQTVSIRRWCSTACITTSLFPGSELAGGTLGVMRRSVL